MAAAPEDHDPWTCIAIGALAYCLSNVVHEGLGHGGACLLAGCRPTELNAIFFDHAPVAAGSLTERFIAIAGSLANLVLGFAALGWLRQRPPETGTGRLFLWLLVAVNLLMAFGYLLFSGIGAVGDWAAATRGLEPAWLVRVALSVVGALLYFGWVPRLLAPDLAPLLAGAASRARGLSLLVRRPYLVGGIVFVAAGLFNAYGMKILLLSAVAASFGGTSLLAWHGFERSGPVARAPVTVRRSRAWIAAAVAGVVLFVGVLGPGIRF